MHSTHRRWTAVVGAATISLAGLSTVAGTAAAEERPQLAWPVVQQKASTYTLDGFRIGYLPPGLERYGIHAKSSTGRHGARTSYISWVQGRDAIYGKVTVVRDERVRTLEDLRKRSYDHLERDSLRKVRNGEVDAYLAEESGDMFWVPEKGVAVSTYLQPEKWDVKELKRFAESVKQRDAGQQDPAEPAKPVDGDGDEKPAEKPAEDPKDDPKAENEGQPPAAEEEKPQDEKPQEEQPAQEDTPQEEAPQQDTPAEEQPEAEQPAEQQPEAEQPAQDKPAQDKPAEEPAQEQPAQQPAPEKPAEAQPAAEKPADETAQQKEQRPGASAERIRACLADELRADRTTTEGKADRAESGSAATARLWRAASEAERTRAADACAQHLNLDREEIDKVTELLVTAEQEEPAKDSEGSDATPDTAQQEDQGQDEGEMTGSGTWADLWDSMPWTLPGVPSNG